MRFLSLFLVALSVAFTVRAGVLPGFRAEPVARVAGFASSVVVDSQGTVYVTTTDGWVHRVDRDGGVSGVVLLPTHAGSNGGLLGMALLDDATAVVHYTVWGGDDLILDDVIAKVDLATGVESRLATFACDVEVHAHGASSEHHGGNPIVAPDGAVFVGLGEYGAQSVAQRPGWNGGRIWRIAPSGEATQWAMGLRNPYDLAWDPERSAVVASDNGENAGDEVNVIPAGSNCGWPRTYGDHAPVEGMLPPVYVFPETVAPTGLVRLDGANPMLRRGFLSGAFVTSSLYFFPSLAVSPVPDPISIVSGFDEAIIDVTQAAYGDVFFVTASFAPSTGVYRLHVPARGDCNGDGAVDGQDMLALLREIDDGGSHRMIEAQDGSYAGSWGCDANADGLITVTDREALRQLLGGRRRAIAH